MNIIVVLIFIFIDIFDAEFKIEIKIIQFIKIQKRTKKKMSSTSTIATTNNNMDSCVNNDTDIKKYSDLYYKIESLIRNGFCMTMTIQMYSRNTTNAYDKIIELLYNPDNTLTTEEITLLCEYYKFIIHDVHGYYPNEDCKMYKLLRTARCT